MNRKSFFALFSLIVFSFLVSGCGGGASGGAIFSAIENEVKLGKSSAKWAVRSMVYYNNTLYCTNGSKIFQKNGRGWTAIPTNWDGAIGLLAADDNNLYVQHFNISTDVSETNLNNYHYEDVQVSVLYGTNAGQTIISSGAMTIFDNQSTNGGREAFVSKYGGSCYKLSSTGTTGDNLGNCKGAVKNTSGGSQLFNTHLVTKNTNTNTAYYINLINNGTKISTEFIIRSSAGDINLENAGENSLSSTKIGAITGLAYYRDKERITSGDEKDYLLVATMNNGYYRVSLDGTNKIDNYPHKNGERIAGLGIIDGSFWTFGKEIYAGVTTSDKNAYGLWAYYDETDAGAWNLY